MNGLWLVIFIPAIAVFMPPQIKSQACAVSGAFMSGGDHQLTKQSGSLALDQNIDIELSELWRAFHVSPSFFLYDDADGANAYATRDVITPGSMGTVAFGVSMIRSEYAKSGIRPNYTIAIILAHEFAHIVQFQSNIQLNGYQRELQADYMAGWYAGNRERNTGTSPAVFKDVAKAFFDLGDYDFTSDSHHGTPAQRVNMVTSGYRDRDLPMQAVLIKSAKYVGSFQSGNDTGSQTSENRTGEARRRRETPSDDAISNEALAQVVKLVKQNALGRIKGAATDSDNDRWETSVQAVSGLACVIDKDDSGYAYDCAGSFSSEEDASKAAQAVEDAYSSLPGYRDRGMHSSEESARHSYDIGDVAAYIVVRRPASTSRKPRWRVTTSIFHQ